MPYRNPNEGGRRRRSKPEKKCAIYRLECGRNRKGDIEGI